MIDFKGKNILMFSPYGATKHYGEAIKDELLKRGAKVKGYDERPSQNALMKIIIRFLKKRIPQIFAKYIDSIIKENRGICFDYILICRGEAFTEFTVNRLKKAFPNAQCILYLWDILETTNVRDVIHCFDKAMSFDPYNVASESLLKFRPTFFVPLYRSVPINAGYKYDIMFIGTLHSNRYKIINIFRAFFEKQGISSFVYLYVPSILVYMKDLICKFPYISIAKVNFTPISLSDTVLKMKESKCVLDINYTNQRSLSMRAYEAMAARRKYVTTNPEIMKYDFYNENNILVVDIKKPIIPRTFIDSPFVDIDAQVLHKYSVEGLVDDLFG